MKKVFVASALFSLAEREFNARLKTSLSDVAEIILPQEGPLLSDLLASGLDRVAAEQRIFQYDLDLISQSEIFLLCLDGTNVDEGAAFELGFAHAKGIRCWGLLTDWRKLGAGAWRNPMLAVPLETTFFDVESLHAALCERH